MGTTSTRRKILLRGKDLARGGIEAWSGDRLDEQLRHLGCGVAIDRPIHADHAAERRHRIAFQRALVGFGQRGCHRGSARIGVLDDGADRLVELLRQVPRRLQIDNVVVAEFLALQLLAVRDALA